MPKLSFVEGGQELDRIEALYKEGELSKAQVSLSRLNRRVFANPVNIKRFEADIAAADTPEKFDVVFASFSKAFHDAEAKAQKKERIMVKANAEARGRSDGADVVEFKRIEKAAADLDAAAANTQAKFDTQLRAIAATPSERREASKDSYDEARLAREINNDPVLRRAFESFLRDTKNGLSLQDLSLKESNNEIPREIIHKYHKGFSAYRRKRPWLRGETSPAPKSVSPEELDEELDAARKTLEVIESLLRGSKGPERERQKMQKEILAKGRQLVTMNRDLRREFGDRERELREALHANPNDIQASEEYERLLELATARLEVQRRTAREKFSGRPEESPQAPEAPTTIVRQEAPPAEAVPAVPPGQSSPAQPKEAKTETAESNFESSRDETLERIGVFSRNKKNTFEQTMVLANAVAQIDHTTKRVGKKKITSAEAANRLEEIRANLEKAGFAMSGPLPTVVQEKEQKQKEQQKEQPEPQVQVPPSAAAPRPRTAEELAAEEAAEEAARKKNEAIEAREQRKAEYRRARGWLHMELGAMTETTGADPGKLMKQVDAVAAQQLNDEQREAALKQLRLPDSAVKAAMDMIHAREALDASAEQLRAAAPDLEIVRKKVGTKERMVAQKREAFHGARHEFMERLAATFEPWTGKYKRFLKIADGVTGDSEDELRENLIDALTAEKTFMITRTTGIGSKFKDVPFELIDATVAMLAARLEYQTFRAERRETATQEEETNEEYLPEEEVPAATTAEHTSEGEPEETDDDFAVARNQAKPQEERDRAVRNERKNLELPEGLPPDWEKSQEAKILNAAREKYLEQYGALRRLLQEKSGRKGKDAEALIRHLENLSDTELGEERNKTISVFIEKWNLSPEEGAEVFRTMEVRSQYLQAKYDLSKKLNDLQRERLTPLVSGEDIENAMKAFGAREIFGELVIEENRRLANGKIDQMPPEKKGRFKRFVSFVTGKVVQGLEGYRNLSPMTQKLFRYGLVGATTFARMIGTGGIGGVLFGLAGRFAGASLILNTRNWLHKKVEKQRETKYEERVSALRQRIAKDQSAKTLNEVQQELITLDKRLKYERVRDTSIEILAMGMLGFATGYGMRHAQAALFQGGAWHDFTHFLKEKHHFLPPLPKHGVSGVHHFGDGSGTPIRLPHGGSPEAAHPLPEMMGKDYHAARSVIENKHLGAPHEVAKGVAAGSTMDVTANAEAPIQPAGADIHDYPGTTSPFHEAGTTDIHDYPGAPHNVRGLSSAELGLDDNASADIHDYPGTTVAPHEVVAAAPDVHDYPVANHPVESVSAAQHAASASGSRLRNFFKSVEVRRHPVGIGPGNNAPGWTSPDQWRQPVPENGGWVPVDQWHGPHQSMHSLHGAAEAVNPNGMHVPRVLQEMVQFDSQTHDLSSLRGVSLEDFLKNTPMLKPGEQGSVIGRELANGMLHKTFNLADGTTREITFTPRQAILRDYLERYRDQLLSNGLGKVPMDQFIAEYTKAASGPGA